MPIYDLKCKSCYKTFEELVSLWEKLEEVKCPFCGSKRTKRLPSRGTNFKLKGGGWYKDGYSSSSSKKKKERNS